ncbi:MAG TPA: hypothetical protein VII06_14680 [Chloroflexota bacterium]|jgi:hypothetical protein
MKRFLLAAALTTAALVWSAPGAAAQSTSCRWVGEGVGLLCDDPSAGTQTLSNWDGNAWTTVPAGTGLYLPTTAGGLSAYGQTFPASSVGSPSSYYSLNYAGNTATQTFVTYGPGNTSRAVTCQAQYWGNTVYQTCR